MGFDTQTYETKEFATGIARVIRETHGWAMDFISAAGIRVGWVNTAARERSYAFTSSSYLASDPVLNSPRVGLAEIDVLVISDIAMLLDVPSILREKKSRGLRVIVIIYDILPLTHPEWFPPEAKKHFRLFLQKAHQIADYFVVNSQFVKEELLGLNWSTAAGVGVIGLGSFWPQRLPSDVPNSQIAILAISTVEPRKGHQRLVEAFDELRATGEDVSLHLVGRRGWAREELYDAIQSHPDFGSRLRWHQDASDQLVSELATRCNLGLIASDGEGFGMFLEEALTLGLKVVASDIPVFREREQPNVFFSPVSSDGLAQTIRQAAQAQWETPITRVRSMRDFAEDFSSFLLGVVREVRTPVS